MSVRSLLAASGEFFQILDSCCGCAAGILAEVQAFWEGAQAAKARRGHPKSRGSTSCSSREVADALGRSGRLRRNRGGEEAISLCALRLQGKASRPVEEWYKRVSTLGSGGYGVVYRARSLATGQDRAMKVLTKRAMSKDAKYVQREVEAIILLDHPHIARFIDFFEQRDSVSVILELCTGGDFSWLLQEDCALAELSILFRDVMVATAYCHGLGIVHRDLKLENCLLAKAPQRRVAKVIDFGLSAVRSVNDQDEEAWLTERLGTKIFAAPEVHAAKEYGSKCDLWSLGVMLYVLLVGQHPFVSDLSEVPKDQLILCIRAAPLRLEPLKAACNDADARELVQKLLVREPARRICAQSALKEPWLTAPPELCLDSHAQNAVALQLLQKLASFRQMTRFARVALMVLAEQAMHVDNEDEARRVFLALDVGGRGMLSKEDVRNGFSLCDFEPTEEMSEAAQLLQSLDASCEGCASWAEWRAAALAPNSISSPALMRGLFCFLDADANQEISRQELCRVVGEAEADGILRSSSCPLGVLLWEHFESLMEQVVWERSGQILRHEALWQRRGAGVERPSP